MRSLREINRGTEEAGIGLGPSECQHLKEETTARRWRRKELRCVENGLEMCVDTHSSQAK